jgi:hypothetical protein
MIGSSHAFRLDPFAADYDAAIQLCGGSWAIPS